MTFLRRLIAHPVRPRRCILFGDSHHALYAAQADIAAWHLGPVTMHRVGRDGPALFDFALTDAQDGDAFAFVFGEIDVRVHVGPQIAGGRDEAAVLETLAGHYVRTLHALRRRFPHSRIVIFSTTPPSGLDYPLFDPFFPRNGADEDRVRWATRLNRLLAARARRAGYLFVDQYSMFADARGLLDLNVTADGTHVRPEFAHRVNLRPIFA